MEVSSEARFIPRPILARKEKNARSQPYLGKSKRGLRLWRKEHQRPNELLKLSL